MQREYKADVEDAQCRNNGKDAVAEREDTRQVITRFCQVR
jgi:hypothetical protein